MNFSGLGSAGVSGLGSAGVCGFSIILPEGFDLVGLVLTTPLPASFAAPLLTFATFGVCPSSSSSFHFLLLGHGSSFFSGVSMSFLVLLSLLDLSFFHF